MCLNYSSAKNDKPMPIVFAGYYCLFGEPNPQPCPAGTYNNETGRDDVTDCSPCSVGQYCEGTGNSVPDGAYYLLYELYKLLFAILVILMLLK